ncbi:MAG: segregation/condensation protein A [Patescibacteria group bacterium]
MKIIKLKQFEGPYDLLLSLIGEKKLDISEIAISEVTEQYLYYLDSLEKKNPEDLADFLVVAAKLLLLKSSRLLPQFAPEEEETESLEEQLKLYRAFVEASKKVNKLWLNSRCGVFRIELPRKVEIFVLPINLSLDSLRESMVQLLNRLKPPKALPYTQIDKAISLKEKVDYIRRLLKNKKSFLFGEVLKNSQNRTEVIVGFLALLELVKLKVVGLRQDEVFGDIIILNCYFNSV